MDDYHVGKHCEFETCRQKQWLPVQCKYCHHTYCAEHSSIESHTCSKIQQHFKKVYTCPLCLKTIQINSNLSVDDNFSIHEAMECSKDFENRNQNLAQCKHFKCRVKLTEINQFNCKYCRNKFCLKHRMQEQHQCII